MVLLITVIFKITLHSLKMILERIKKSEFKPADFKEILASVGKNRKHILVTDLGKYNLATYKFI